jgi:hypothetical protein
MDNLDLSARVPTYNLGRNPPVWATRDEVTGATRREREQTSNRCVMTALRGVPGCRRMS